MFFKKESKRRVGYTALPAIESRKLHNKKNAPRAKNPRAKIPANIS
jgi:hypothetical protein